MGNHADVAAKALSAPLQEHITWNGALRPFQINNHSFANGSDQYGDFPLMFAAIVA
jgi:hypothetical protein